MASSLMPYAMPVRRLAAACVLLALPLGCNTLLGIEEPGRQDGAAGGAGAAGAAGGAGGPASGAGGRGPAAGAAGDGSGGDGSGSGGEAPAPPCDASEGPGEGVFVDPRVGDDGNDGTTIRPFQTLARAAAEAVAKRLETVYLAPGSYQEALALRVGADDAAGVVSAPEGTRLSFDGGWTLEGTRWRRDCSPDARENTVLASPTTTGVSVRGPFGPIAFRNLSIATVAAAPPAVDGQPAASCYGLNASGAGLRLRLQNVELDACPGGEGGAVPAPTPPETFQCVETGAKCASGQPGADASGVGAPGERGTFGDEGFVHGDGAQGARGEPGAAGTAGPGQGEPLTCFVGGSGACCDALTQVPQGRCGCGGVAGFGGPGGRGGGASVALFVRGPNASVELAFATLRARDGGRGSPGAEGSPGSLGAPGAAYPGLAGCCVGCDGQCFLQGCGDLPAQAAGGQGGKGGKGGKGGGGSGGPSFAFVGVGAELERSESVLSFGRPGAGAEGAAAGDAGAQTSVSGPAPGEMNARGAP